MTPPRTLLLPLAALALRAAGIHGTVVEMQSGHPIARATVTLQPLAPGSPPQPILTNTDGIFEFKQLPAGMYRIAAARPAFAPVQYGQKRWLSIGAPLALSEDDSFALTIRLPRFGAITGTVLDENDVGLPDHEVAVYNNTHPPRLLARAHTDDRGMYRLFNLRPGVYFVRSLPKMYEDGGYLPTFYGDSPTLDHARPIEVTLDEQVDRVDFHAAPGRLYSVAGRVLGSREAAVSLASDTGTQYAETGDRGFNFEPMPPGQYEMLAVSPPDRYRAPMAGYQILTVDRDFRDLYISLSPLPTVRFTFVDLQGRSLNTPGMQIQMRRKDSAGDAPAQILQFPASGESTLLPGRWEVAFDPGPQSYVAAFTPAQSEVPMEGRADGWNDILLPPGTQNVVKFAISSTPSTLSGTVRNPQGNPVSAITVFIEPADLEPDRRLVEVRAAQTNAQGQYQFTGLAPGVYRLLATFEYQTPGAAEMEASGAKSIQVEEASKTVVDLDEFVIQ